MNLSDFDYELPKHLIAQTPLSERSDSKLLVLDKESGIIQHRVFTDIVELLDEKDTLVINNTRVIPARLLGEKTTGGAVEFLLLNRTEGDFWEVMVKPGKRAKTGTEVIFGGGLLSAEVIDELSCGNRIVSFKYDGIWEEILDKLGEMPLPPYITEKLKDKERYQTVYGKIEGSSAAPTAGLHWTPELLERVREKGVSVAEVTLHVGLGTFRPVKLEDLTEHNMHSEYYCVSRENAEIVNGTEGKVIAVGTTTARVLETLGDEDGRIKAGAGWTDIFIYPPYEFKVVDRLITNFHLPKSTLLMLVSSLAGRENILNAYIEAIDKDYRFFSFGDAMFIK